MVEVGARAEIERQISVYNEHAEKLTNAEAGEEDVALTPPKLHEEL